MRWTAIVLLNTSLLFATACDSNKGPIHHGFGKSVNQNMMVHIIKPRRPDPNTPAPELEGPRAFGAIDRYNKGETKELQEEATSNRPAKGSGGK